MGEPLRLDNLLMPGTPMKIIGRFPSRSNGTVIASAFIDVEEYPDEQGYLVLMPEKPYYAVVRRFVFYGEIKDYWFEFENIVPAVADYRELTGCW